MMGGHGETMGGREESRRVYEAKSQHSKSENQKHLGTKAEESCKKQLLQPPTHSHPFSCSAYCISNISARKYMFTQLKVCREQPKPLMSFTDMYR